MSLTPNESKVYLVGGGLASLASAVFLVNDAGLPGRNISIFEKSDVLGGALDGSGDPSGGYVVRGGRMHEEHFPCYWNLFSKIPSYDDPNTSMTDEAFSFNLEFVSNARARLLKNGSIVDVSSFGLSLRHRFELAKLTLTPEKFLDNKSIEEWFSKDFFSTNFWQIWTSMFAFQLWSSVTEMRRYMRRFIHLVEGLPYLGGIMRTKYNQYHSDVIPLQRFLRQAGVQFHMNTLVLDVEFNCLSDQKTATSLLIRENSAAQRSIKLNSNDYVFVTLGSITECSDNGTWKSAPVLKDKSDSGAWMLWENIANKHKEFGNPGVFSNNIQLQKWYSFTATLQDETFHDHMQRFTGNEHGTGGLVTITDSNWLMSIVIARQPHFPDQSQGVYIFWGYGLYPDRAGNYVKKPMSECNGEEILEELWHHLKIKQLMSPVVKSGKVNNIPVAMPFIDSLFMPRAKGDRPNVIPTGATNFAFLGQFVEIPKDCVFTVEYSVRSAQMAVYHYFQTGKAVPDVYNSIQKPSVLIKAIRALQH